MRLPTALARTMLLLLSTLCPVFANTPDEAVSFDATVDWEEGQLVIQAETDLEAGYSGASARARRRILRQREGVYLDAVLGLHISSTETGQDVFAEQPYLVEKLNERQALGSATGIRPSRDLRTARLEIEHPLYEGIAGVIHSHEIARPIPRSSGWVPSREYTGLVIDARGELPVHGEDRDAHIEPVLLPRVYDTDARLLLEAPMLEPEYLRRWGVAGYTTSDTLETLTERVGTDPLFIAADALFGTRPANPVIPHETAERLLTVEHNRRILSEGRIVILVEPADLE